MISSLFNNPSLSILRYSYLSEGVKDVYRCFCFILRSLLQPQFIKRLRQPHCCLIHSLFVLIACLALFLFIYI